MFIVHDICEMCVLTPVAYPLPPTGAYHAYL